MYIYNIHHLCMVKIDYQDYRKITNCSINNAQLNGQAFRGKITSDSFRYTQNSKSEDNISNDYVALEGRRATKE